MFEERQATHVGAKLDDRFSKYSSGIILLPTYTFGFDIEPLQDVTQIYTEVDLKICLSQT